jgi:hypothetical protein
VNRKGTTRWEGDCTPFCALNEVLNRFFYKPDLQAERIVLGTLQAHYLRLGDSAWLFHVAPPGTGKTTRTILAASELPTVISVGDFNESTFLSGFFEQREPGLLERLGETVQDGRTYTTTGDGIFVIKDFTTVLSKRRDTRAVILSQFREIHDGEFRRSFGTGVTKIWRGRVSIVAAVTPALDRHYSIFGILGERFLQVRSHRPDCHEAGEWAIKQQGLEQEILQEARQAVGQLFTNAPKEPPVLSDHMRGQIAAIAEVTALARTQVVRSSNGKREIVYVPEAEANTRISKGLAAMVKGIASLAGRKQVTDAELQDGFRVALDCLPEYRRKLLKAVLAGQSVNSVAIPRTVRGRELEDLRELGILTAASQFTDRIAELLWLSGLSQCVREGVF